MPDPIWLDTNVVSRAINGNVALPNVCMDCICGPCSAFVRCCTEERELKFRCFTDRLAFNGTLQRISYRSDLKTKWASPRLSTNHMGRVGD